MAEGVLKPNEERTKTPVDRCGSLLYWNCLFAVISLKSVQAAGLFHHFLFVYVSVEECLKSSVGLSLIKCSHFYVFILSDLSYFFDYWEFFFS